MKNEKKKDGVRLVFEQVSPLAREHIKYLAEFYSHFDTNIDSYDERSDLLNSPRTEGEWISKLIMEKVVPMYWGEEKINRLNEEFSQKIKSKGMKPKL